MRKTRARPRHLRSPLTALSQLERIAGDGKTGRLPNSVLRDEQRMLAELLKELSCLRDAMAQAELDAGAATT
jgi:hypothetical protein